MSTRLRAGLALGAIFGAVLFARSAGAAEPSEELARQACRAMREAGVDPASEVKTRNVSKAQLSSAAKKAVLAADLDYTAVRVALKRYPATLEEGGPVTSTGGSGGSGGSGSGGSGGSSTGGTGGGSGFREVPFDGNIHAGPCALPAGVEGPPVIAKPEGFAAGVTGGDSGTEIAITQATNAATLAAFAQASRGGNSKIVFRCRGDIDLNPNRKPLVNGNNITIDGMGQVTLWGDQISNRNNPLLSIGGNNLIVRNIRLRNGGDCITLGGSSYPGATNVMISHVTVTGSGDDGFSLAYGGQNVTVQWCFASGCTRAIFIKYPRPRPIKNISIHHTYVTRQCWRAPLAAYVQVLDFRNNLITNWRSWGSRYEKGATGNAVNNMHVLDAWCKSRQHVSLYLKSDAGPVYMSGNAGKRCLANNEGTRAQPYPVAPVTTHSAEEAERLCRQYSGCLPRDAADQEMMTVQHCAPCGKAPIGMRTPLTTRKK